MGSPCCVVSYVIERIDLSPSERLRAKRPQFVYHGHSTVALHRNPDAPAPEGAIAPAELDDSDDDMSSTSSFSDDD